MEHNFSHVRSHDKEQSFGVVNQIYAVDINGYIIYQWK